MSDAVSLRKEFVYPKDYESLGLCSHGATYVNKEQLIESERKLAKANSYLEAEAQAKRDYFDKILKLRVELDDSKFLAEKYRQSLVMANKLIVKIKKERDDLKFRLDGLEK